MYHPAPGTSDPDAARDLALRTVHARGGAVGIPGEEQGHLALRA
jgi:hypothetical protein